MEVRNIELKHLDFDRHLLHVVQSKGNKDRYVPLSEHLIRGIRRFIAVEQPVKYLFEGSGNPEGKGFDGRYSQKGVQWAVKTVARQAGIIKDVHSHTLRHTYATHLLEDGVNILVVQKLLGHANIESTMVYLHVCQTPDRLPHSPLDKVFSLCARSSK
jgi:site-specific recombinase XerD